MDHGKKLAMMILGGGSGDGPHEDAPGDASPLRMAAKELIDAVHAKDEQGVEDALHAAFMACDGMPHDEGDHPDDAERGSETY